jgi:hypothetical protein
MTSHDNILMMFRSFYSKDIGKVRRDTLHKTNRLIGEEQQDGGFTVLTVSPFVNKDAQRLRS